MATGGSPSWLAAHPTLDVVYAALEDAGSRARVPAAPASRSFAPLGGAVAGGEALCHIAVAPDGGSLVASCWGDGRVVRMSLDAAGRPSAPVIAQAAATRTIRTPLPAEFAGGIDLAAAAQALRAAAGAEFAHLVPDYDDADEVPADAARDAPADASARVSRAHQAVFLPGGLIATTDMGLDLVRFWRPTDAGLRPLQQVVLPLGTGPRHMVWHPSGHLYVVAELSCEVFALARRRHRFAGGSSRARRSGPARCPVIRPPSSRHPATAPSSTRACAAATPWRPSG